MGIASVDSAARVVPRPVDGRPQGRPIGVAATTCSLQDVIESDLVVLWGANPANNQPVFMKYLYLAKQRGLPGRRRQPVPRARPRALLGAVERSSRRCSARRCATSTCRCGPAATSRWPTPCSSADRAGRGRRGVRRRPHRRAGTSSSAALDGQDARRPARRGRASTATQLDAFVDAVRRRRRGGPRVVDGHHPAPRRGRRRAGIVNLASPGQRRAATAPGSCRSAATPACRAAPRWAPTPPRCPGGVPVDAEHAAALARAVGLRRCPTAPGLTAPEMVEAAGRGELDVLWIVGRQLPRGAARPARGARPRSAGCRCASTRTSCSPRQMLVDGRRRDPAAGRHPLRAGGRRHRDHHRAPHRVQPRDPPPGRRGPQRVAALRRRRQPGAARPARRASRWPTNQALRAEIAEVVPLYAGIEDAGRHRRRGAVGRPPPLRRRRRSRRPTGRGRFTVARRPPTPTVPDGRVHRRRPGGASSSTRWSTAAVDPLTGAGRDAVYIDAADAAALGRRRRATASCCARATGTLRRARVKLVRLPARTLQVHWPEGNVLIAGGADHREPQSKVPDYNAVVTVERV